MRRKWVLFVAPPVFLLFIAIGGFVVRELWNWLLPPLFGLPSVTFWQALGVLALSRILFGGCGWRGSSRSSRTPEERERVRQAFRKRFGFGPPASDTSAQ